MLNRERLARAVGDRWSEAELGEAVALMERAEGRFPPGVRTLPSELVKAVQRERLLVAMASALTEKGFNALTVQDVLTCARISRPTFYEQFTDKEDCFLAALDAAAARMRERVELAASRSGATWRDRLHGGLEELLRFIAEEPEDARLVIVESRSSSPAALRRREELLDRFATCIAAQVKEEVGKAPSATTAAGIVGGIESVLYARLQRGGTDQLDALLAPLMHFAASVIDGGSRQSVEALSG